MAVNFIVVLGLIICTWTDLRERKIYLPVIVLDIVMLIIAQIALEVFSSYVVVTGLCIGIAFLFLYFITDGQLGTGDVLLFAMVAFAKQGIGLLYCIFLTLILLFGTAIFLMVLKKAGMKTQLPVAPFLLAAYSLVILGENMN